MHLDHNKITSPTDLSFPPGYGTLQYMTINLPFKLKAEAEYFISFLIPTYQIIICHNSGNHNIIIKVLYIPKMEAVCTSETLVPTITQRTTTLIFTIPETSNLTWVFFV
jgi:hypothetical protein